MFFTSTKCFVLYCSLVLHTGWTQFVQGTKYGKRSLLKRSGRLFSEGALICVTGQALRKASSHVGTQGNTWMWCRALCKTTFSELLDSFQSRVGCMMLAALWSLLIVTRG